MATGSTPVWARPYPLESDGPDVAADIHSLALNLENVPTSNQGTLSARPSASSVPFGYQYHATDTGDWFKSTGAAWVAFAQLDSGGHVPLAELSGITDSQFAASVLQGVVQTAVPQTVAIDHADMTLAWSSSSSVNATALVVNHSLGRAPLRVFTSLKAGGLGGNLFTVSISALTTTTFTANASSSVVGPFSEQFSWMALG